MPAEAPTQTSSSLAAVPAPSCLPVRDLAHGVTLSGVSWNVYVELRDSPANRGLRMTYTDGELEIMTTSSFHELISLLIHDFILEWRVAQSLPVRPTGSMTLRRHSLLRGLEGDQSYYIAHESQVRALSVIDLDSSPPPDLAIEVEHTSPAVRKLPIYAQLKVPEVWRWRDETLSVLRLVDGEYAEQTESVALIGFPVEQLRSALGQRTKYDETALVSEFRKWLDDPTTKGAQLWSGSGPELLH